MSHPTLALAAALLLTATALAGPPQCYGTVHTRHNKRAIAARQGISDYWNYELDHRIPLCLGGPDTEDNLQLQPWPQARLKDADEWRLCEGSITQDDAISEIKHLWPRE